MLITELKPFYDVYDPKFKNILPTDRLNVEEHLFLFSVDYAHAAQLMWSKYNGKKTESYLNFLYESCFEHIMAASLLSEVAIDELFNGIVEAYKTIETLSKNDSDNLLVSSLILTNEAVIDPIFRFALFTRCIELTFNTNLNKILEHYQSCK